MDDEDKASSGSASAPGELKLKKSANSSGYMYEDDSYSEPAISSSSNDTHYSDPTTVSSTASYSQFGCGCRETRLSLDHSRLCSYEAPGTSGAGTVSSLDNVCARRKRARSSAMSSDSGVVDTDTAEAISLAESNRDWNAEFQTVRVTLPCT